MKHRGIFTEEFMEKKIRIYHWPDIRAKIYFGKVVSDKWKETLNKYTYSYGKVKSIFMMKDGYWNANNLYELCDVLKLYLLLINEKPDYHLKFNDVCSNSGSMAFFEYGPIKADRFLKWWFNDYEEIMNEIETLKKK